MTDLGSIGTTSSVALSINNKGQVVGYTTGGSQPRAFYYANGTMSDLNTLIRPGTGWSLSEATGINDAGQITGGSLATVGSSHVLHPFLYTPANGIQDLGLPSVSSPNGIYAQGELINGFPRIAGTVFDALTNVPLASFVYSVGAPGGYLVLGHSESMIGTSLAVRQVAPAVFQKL